MNSEGFGDRTGRARLARPQQLWNYSDKKPTIPILGAAYAWAARVFTLEKRKEILPNGNPKRPLKIVWVVLMILFLAVFGTFLLMLAAAFLLNLAFWNGTDKKCAFALCFFISQSVLYWVWLCEEREEPPGVK